MLSAGFNHLHLHLSHFRLLSLGSTCVIMFGLKVLTFFYVGSTQRKLVSLDFWGGIEIFEHSLHWTAWQAASKLLGGVWSVGGDIFGQHFGPIFWATFGPIVVKSSESSSTKNYFLNFSMKDETFFHIWWQMSVTCQKHLSLIFKRGIPNSKNNLGALMDAKYRST